MGSAEPGSDGVGLTGVVVPGAGDSVMREVAGGVVEVRGLDVAGDEGVVAGVGAVATSGVAALQPTTIAAESIARMAVNSGRAALVM